MMKKTEIKALQCAAGCGTFRGAPGQACPGCGGESAAARPAAKETPAPVVDRKDEE
jgi:hypothetical protein